MTYLLLQTFLLLLASYFLGAFLACLVRRTFFAGRVGSTVREAIPAVVIPAVAVPKPVRAAPRIEVAPRPFDPVQPRIEVFKRPEPRKAPKLVDPSRFERALFGPDPNEGIPRKPIVEIRPAILASPTGAPEPVRPAAAQPAAAPKPVPAPKPAAPTPAPSIAKIVAQEVARDNRETKAPGTTGAPQPRPADATTAAAAAAVAASKAAAAASIAASVAPSRSEPKPPPPTPVAAPPAPPPPSPPPPQPVVETKPEFKMPDPPITDGDDLQRIRAIDALSEQKLKSTGVLYFDHLAGWSQADVKRIGQALDLGSRIDREQWIEQAQILAKGGETYYSRNRAASLKSAKKPDAPSAAADPAASPAVSDVVAPKSPGASAAAPAAAAAPATAPAPSSPPPAAQPTPPGNSAAPAPPKPASETPSATGSNFAANTSGKSVAELAQAAAAAIAAASASVTRGLRPIEPISPLSKVDPKISIPAKLSDAIKERSASGPAPQREPGSGQAPASGPSAATAQSDDLKRIRGIGVLIEKRLKGTGVTRYEHIASWTSADIDRFSRMLEFKGRIERENWIEQARILANGGQTEFSRRVDRGEVDTSSDT